jgi:hypothetical protein
MAKHLRQPKTLEDVCQLAESADPPGQRRNGGSATERICAKAGVLPAEVAADAPSIRALLRKLRPALHGMMAKTWTNLLSRFRQELRLGDVIDPNRQGCAARHPAWAHLVQAIAKAKNLANGLAAFINWCASHDIVPDAVDDSVVQRFHAWLEQRTLCPKPRDLVRQTPRLWNEASEQVKGWPRSKLTLISFKAPLRRMQWGELPECFRKDAEAYLAMRANPDPFDERPNAPIRPLAASTIEQQRAHLRLAASVLIESGMPVEALTAVAVLVDPGRFKTILRHYHEQANQKANAFVIGLAKTLIQAAQYYLGATTDEIAQLKRIATKLRSVPCDLTEKNKAVALQLPPARKAPLPAGTVDGGGRPGFRSRTPSLR